VLGQGTIDRARFNEPVRSGLAENPIA
jgi:hypothetical protein